MENVVYFLGAGFSAPLGLPLMNNFLSMSKDIYFENPEKYDYFQKVFDTIAEMSVTKNYYNSNLHNIEEILSLLEMRNMLDTKRIPVIMKNYISDVINHFTPEINWDSKLPGNWQNFVFGKNQIHNYYGYFLANLFNLELIRFDLAKPPTHPEKFEMQIIKDVRKTYSIITLNYDLVLENIVNYLNTNFYGENLRLTYNMKETKSERKTYLTKLHGSADSKEIIAPTWNKVIRNKYIKDNWETAYNLLTEANHIRIVGYSLPITDSYVKFLLKTAIIKKRTPHLKTLDVICLDNDGSVKRRYDDFIEFENYRFKNADFITLLRNNYELSSGSIIKEASSGPVISRIRCNTLERAHNSYM